MIRNKNGTSIIAGARSVECLALRDGFWMVKSRGFKRIIVGDSKLVLEDICRLAGFFEDIFWRMQLRVLVSLLMIFRTRIFSHHKQRL